MSASELVDYIDSFSVRIHKKAKIRLLSEQLREIDTTCGSCVFWMTRDCPREKQTMQGRSMGPSCSALACNKFNKSQQMRGLEKEIQEKLDLLKD
jgi:hypothetical protein